MPGTCAKSYPVVMQLTMENAGNPARIEHYDEGLVRIAGQTCRGTVLVTGSAVHSPWGPETPAGIHAGHIESLLELQPELVLLGTGAQALFPPREALRLAIRAGIGIEVMTTAAACRTHNVVIAEGRNVATLLFMIEAPCATAQGMAGR